MSELDDRHLLLRGEVRQWAADLRQHALALDGDPELVTRLVHLPAVAWSGRLQIPARYNPRPLVVGGERFHLTSALERTIFCEEIAYADLGLMLALPGGSMTGVLVDAIGDEAQKEWVYGQLLQRPTWTFFALTEPAGGSDAGALRTRLVPAARGDGFVLHGAKRFVSNVVRARFGVVFFRSGPGVLGAGAALVEAGVPGLRVEAMSTLGVRGAQLGTVTLDGVEVAADRILGRHLSAVRRGTWGWLRTLNKLRPTVAAMSVGLAQAAHDYVRDNRRDLPGRGRDWLDVVGRRIESVRRLARRAAIEVDRDAGAGHLACAAKDTAARLGRRTTAQALTFFGPGARLEHPILDKFARDALGMEFMEGTSNIQRLSLFTALHKGALAAEFATVPDPGSACSVPD